MAEKSDDKRETTEDPPPEDGDDDQNDNDSESSDGEDNEDGNEDTEDPPPDPEPKRKPKPKARAREDDGGSDDPPAAPDIGKLIAEATAPLREELSSLKETIEKGVKSNGGGRNGDDPPSSKTESRRGRGFLWGG